MAGGGTIAVSFFGHHHIVGDEAHSGKQRSVLKGSTLPLIGSKLEHSKKQLGVMQ